MTHFLEAHAKEVHDRRVVIDHQDPSHCKYGNSETATAQVLTQFGANSASNSHLAVEPQASGPPP